MTTKQRCPHAFMPLIHHLDATTNHKCGTCGFCKKFQCEIDTIQEQNTLPISIQESDSSINEVEKFDISDLLPKDTSDKINESFEEIKKNIVDLIKRSKELEQQNKDTIQELKEKITKIYGLARFMKQYFNRDISFKDLISQIQTEEKKDA